MKKARLFITAIVAVSTFNVAFGQWTSSGTASAYNTSLLTGKIGIGVVPTEDNSSSYQPILQIKGNSGNQPNIPAFAPRHILSILSNELPSFGTYFGIATGSYGGFLSTNAPYNIVSNGLYIRSNISGNDGSLYVGGKIVVGDPAMNKPAGYKLFVETGILTEKLKVAVKNSSNWSDYVFDKDYKLLSLGEVESYIKKHKHLPGVPSAEEVVKEGIDMATMDAKLLEKIEELTLYMIQLKKENEQLTQNNKTLADNLKMLSEKVESLQK